MTDTHTDSTAKPVSSERTEELTTQDFAGLPQRPVRYRPEYRRDVKHFLFICASVAVFVLVVVLLQSL